MFKNITNICHLIALPIEWSESNLRNSELITIMNYLKHMADPDSQLCLQLPRTRGFSRVPFHEENPSVAASKLWLCNWAAEAPQPLFPVAHPRFPPGHSPGSPGSHAHGPRGSTRSCTERWQLLLGKLLEPQTQPCQAPGRAQARHSHHPPVVLD